MKFHLVFSGDPCSALLARKAQKEIILERTRSKNRLNNVTKNAPAERPNSDQKWSSGGGGGGGGFRVVVVVLEIRVVVVVLGWWWWW